MNNFERAKALTLYVYSGPYQLNGEIVNDYHPLAYHTFDYWDPKNDNNDALAQLAMRLFCLQTDSKDLTTIIKNSNEIREKLYKCMGSYDLDYRHGVKDIENSGVGYLSDYCLSTLENARRRAIQLLSRGRELDKNDYDDGDEDEDYDGEVCEPKSKTKPAKRRY